MCEIQITKVAGINPSLTSINVVGTVERCSSNIEGQRLIVKIACPPEIAAFGGDPGILIGPFVEATDIFFGDDGLWFATFENFSSCRCRGQISVIAQCASDEGCEATLTIDNLDCVECPDIRDNKGSDDVSPKPIPRCNPDGTATVTLRKFVENNTQTPLLVQIFPGHPDAALDPPNSPNTASVFPGEIKEVTATYRYPTLSSPQPYLVIQDLQSNLLGCPAFPIDLDPLPSCCPEIEIESVRVEECLVIVRVVPTTIPEGCTYIWDWGDGSPQEFSSIGQRNHTYEKKESAQSYTVTVRVSCGNGGCVTSAEEQVRLEACESEDCGWLGWKCWDWCLIGRTALFLLLATAGILWMLVACFPAASPLVVAAVAASAAAAVVLAIWQWTCGNRCDWLVILWQFFLVLGIAALYLMGCCPVLLWFFIGSFVLAGIFFEIWRRKCQPARCDIYEAMLWVFGTAIVAVFAIIDQQNLPGFQGDLDCRLAWVKWGTILLLAVFTGLFSGCTKD